MKETEEEEIFKKVKDKLSKHPIKLPPLDHMKAFAKLYHQERMKSILPSEQEIEALFNKCSLLRFDNNTKLMTLGDFKDALTLLTKGDR